MLWVPLITGLAIVLVVLQSQLRSSHQPWAILLSTAFIVVSVIMLIPQLAQIISLFHDLSGTAGVDYQYLGPVLKTIAVAYVTSFGAEICRDADENAMAAVVELAGKTVILLVAIPVVQAVLYGIFGIIGS